MKIALIHDYLCDYGGSERVFSYICETYPEADIYALSYCPDKTFSFFNSREIHTTWLNAFVRNTKIFRYLFPLSTYVMQYKKLDSYDLVLTSSATVAKYIKPKKAFHICYCYFPTRAIWQSNVYFKRGITKTIFQGVLSYLKRRDLSAARRVDKFIAISNYTKNKIAEIYNKESSVIYCPIDLDKYHVSSFKEDYYLLVSRLEKWKRVDYAIEAFNENGKNLYIVGDGPDRTSLQDMAKGNIQFLGRIDDDRLVDYYARAKAVVFTPFLEYGLIPLESCACGTPVLCYGKGGVLETMIPYNKENNNASESTAVFFDEQTPESLNAAINEFEKISFNSKFLTEHVKKWSIPEFKKNLKKTVDDLYEK